MMFKLICHTKMKRLFVIFAFTTILQESAFAEDIECFADGECTGSLYVDEWPAADAQECLDICKEYVGCEFFTYHGDDDLCLGLVNCVELDDKKCNDCYSGYKACPDLQCWIPGSCEGITISTDVVSREEECLTVCKNTDGCNWFTFNESDGTCILLGDCVTVDDIECATCWSAQVQCGERQDLTKVLVIGGYTNEVEYSYNGYLDHVEAIDLSSRTPNCDEVAHYPFPVSYTVGTMLEGRPTVCGGTEGDSQNYRTNECYQYIYEENRWLIMEPSMLEARAYHAASMVDSATWFITGGRINETDVIVDSTEVWHDGKFFPGPALPSTLEAHCQVTLNSSYIAILGGYDNEFDFLRDFYLLDWKNEEWIPMPDVPVFLDSDPCGLIENSVNGFELVVLSEYDECYIFNFNNMTWRDGPTIPYGIEIMANEIPVQMEKTFYIIGGTLETISYGTFSDVIFKFDNENYVWHLEPQKLEVKRGRGVAISVPDEMVNCN